MLNSKTESLKVRAYGRNIHNLVDYAKHIEDRRYRQVFVEKIVDLMMELYPPVDCPPEEHYLKLWAHILKMADYELDVLTPEGIELHPVEMKPEPIPYPKRHNPFPQYGRNIQKVIERAKELEPWRQRELLELVGSYMKLAYNSWGREVATNDIIFQDFNLLSKGMLRLPKDIYLDAHIAPRKRPAQEHPMPKSPPVPGRNLKGNKFKKRR